jgi:hypothetical protein
VHRKGKVLENELHVIRILIQHLLEQRREPRAVWSLIVIED